jgi:competence protein ComEC
VPVALGLTAGMLSDRMLGSSALLLGFIFLIGISWWIAASRFQSRFAVWGVLVACVALGAAHHHQYRNVFPADDLGRSLTIDPRPFRVRGVLAGEPEVRPIPSDPLRTMPRSETATADLDVTEVESDDRWQRATGRVRLTVPGRLNGLHAGDTVEVFGWLSAPAGPSNPGEFDWAEHARDERLRGQLIVRKTPHGIVRLERGWTASVAGWLGAIRGWGQRTLSDCLPPEQAAVADALLLGDGAALTRDEWDVYIRTGVIHALAISGQHLVVLAAFLWLGLRFVGVRRKRGAWIVGILLFAYAIITGARPPAVRAAIQVAAICGAIVLRRVPSATNTFALAWIVVLLVKPTDIADTGFLLSFLCVAVLTWGIAPWFAQRQQDPLDRLIAASRPRWMRFLIGVGKWIAAAYVVTLVLGLAVMPLTAARYHLISPIGILIGPPVIVLTSIALIAGFLLLVVAAMAPIAAIPFAWLTQWTLATNSAIVSWADRIPGGHVYVSDVPTWWVIGSYVGLFAAMLLPFFRVHWRMAAFAAIGWLAIALTADYLRPRDDSLRITFLAVGHGGCTVLETPDGRTILFDAGAMTGPEITQRVIAPFLWTRGIRRIDDVLLSHADLDHFNGLPDLLDRFRVGRVLVTPTFSEKPTPGVQLALREILNAGVSMRIVKTGDQLVAGNVTLNVLHPPVAGPEGLENLRSLTVRVEHAGRSLLLTGDVQGLGLDQVLRQPHGNLDVLQAPHHGSRTSNTPALARWARPKVVVSNEGAPTWPTNVPAMYADHGARYLSTWKHGAVTIVSHQGGLVVETYRTKERFVAR